MPRTKKETTIEVVKEVEVSTETTTIEETLKVELPEIVKEKQEEYLAFTDKFVKMSDELKAEISANLTEYNTCLFNDELEGIGKKMEIIKEKINEYTAISRNLAFARCKYSTNPMLCAIIMGQFTSFRIKEDKDKATKISSFKLQDKTVLIDLLQLHQFCDGIGENEQWASIAQKLNFVLASKISEKLNVPFDANTYDISQVGKNFSFGDDPLSNTNFLKSLKIAITAMLGEDFAKSALKCDTEFMYHCYVKVGRGILDVQYPIHRSFCEILMKICHRIVTKGFYNATHPTIK